MREQGRLATRRSGAPALSCAAVPTHHRTTAPPHHFCGGHILHVRHIVRPRSAEVRCIELIGRHPGLVATVTADNATEFHSYAEIEVATGALFYFATPHHSWERGTNENTNGLLRQYLPKRTSMAHVTQTNCDAIAAKLNSRPRKRLGYRTPEECYVQAR